jgi:hypothetical protein
MYWPKNLKEILQTAKPFTETTAFDVTERLSTVKDLRPHR